MGAGWIRDRELGDPWDSKHPRILLALRPLFFLFTVAIFLVGIISIPNFYFIYLTHWGVSAVLLFYSFALLAIRWQWFSQTARTFFELAWTLEFIISIVFWTWVYPQETEAAPLEYNISVHAMMLVFVLCDYRLNRLYFRPRWIVCPILVLLCYSVVNIPITFYTGEVYPEMTYVNGWTYLIVFISFVICIAAFFFAKFLDRFKSSKRHPSLSTEMLNQPEIPTQP